MLNFAKDTLDKLSPPDKRKEAWDKLLVKLFDLEVEMLEMAIDDYPDLSLPTDELIEMVDRFEAMYDHCDNVFKPYVKSLQDMTNRLGKSRSAYHHYIFHIKEEIKRRQK